jgi:hypothetical protein
MECSLQAKYHYEDNLPRRNTSHAVFGTIIHACLQHYYESRGDYEGAARMFKRMWSDPARAGHPIDTWLGDVSYGTFMSRGKRILQYVHESHRWQDFTVLATEAKFLVPFGEHELTGYIDLLGLQKSGTGAEQLQVVDFKTAGKNPSFAQLGLDVQFTSYLYAVAQREFWVGVEGNPDFGGLENGEWLWSTVGQKITTRAIWWGVYTGKQIDAGPRTDRDFQRLYRVMCEIDKSIKAGIAVPKIGDACQLCDYQAECALEIPVAINQVTDKADPKRWV